MQTDLERVDSHEACSDDCCQDPPGFGKAYAIGMGTIFGLIILVALINAIIN